MVVVVVVVDGGEIAVVDLIATVDAVVVASVVVDAVMLARQLAGSKPSAAKDTNALYPPGRASPVLVPSADPAY